MWWWWWCILVISSQRTTKIEAREFQRVLNGRISETRLDSCNELVLRALFTSRQCPTDVLQFINLLRCDIARKHQRWITKFLARHPTIRLGKPSGLDPLRAQCFNKANIDQHFDELEEVLEKKGIPWCNVYNMDEKGCQRGGGRRMQSIKFFIPRTRQPHYKLRGGNLQLTTIIECICADGTELPPGFVFPGKQFHEEWFSDLPEGIW